jgi:hypothetical protein
MNTIQRVIATGGILAGLAGVMMLMLAASVPAQTPEDLQRQLDRAERGLESLRAEQYRMSVDIFSRLSAVERETEINRYVIYGLGGGLLMQVVISGLTLRKINGRR